jgi:N-acetylglucosamine kinase-like BadF-type ATPase
MAHATPHLIADSGSTKTAWRVLAYGHVLWAHETSGINPNVLSFAQIAAQLTEELLPALPHLALERVTFYGASFSTATYCQQMQTLLAEASNVPPHQVAVHHDILGAAHAVAGTAPAIVCILGTGSNSCYYDGLQMVRQVGGHGYLFGDEGGGVYLGKQLLARLLNGQASTQLQARFATAYPAPLMAQRNAVYSAPKPNAALAAYAPFVHANLDLPELRTLVADAFDAFLQTTVLQHPEHRKVPVHAVGSIAHHFAPLWQQALVSHHLQAGQVVQKPIDGLVAYYQKTHG